MEAWKIVESQKVQFHYKTQNLKKTNGLMIKLKKQRKNMSIEITEDKSKSKPTKLTQKIGKSEVHSMKAHKRAQ